MNVLYLLLISVFQSDDINIQVLGRADDSNYPIIKILYTSSMINQ